MKILIFSQYFYPESFRVNLLAKELVLRGHEVKVVTGYPQYPGGKIYEGYGFSIPYEKTWNGVQIDRVKMRPRGRNAIGLLLNSITYVTQANKWVRRCKEKYDVVFVLQLSPVTVGLPARKYKKKFGTPILFNVQDLWPESVEEVLGIRTPLVIAPINYIVRKLYRSSDRILCSSGGFIDNIAKRHRIPKEKLTFWPQFCEAPRFSELIKPSCYDDRYFNIAFTGNLGDAQGLDLLLDAAELLKNTVVRWYLVGDGRARERLEKKVKEKALQENVFFMGRVSEHEANAYVHFANAAYISFQNNALLDLTIPAKLQTYLACGTPILGAIGGESANIIQTSGTGVLAERTPQSLANAVRELCLMDKDTLAQYRENAKQYFASHFTMDTLITELEDMMQNYSSLTE